MTTDYTDTIPQGVIDAANLDPIVGGHMPSDRQRVAIYLGQEIVGFFQPCEIAFNNHVYARTGNIFIVPEHRGKGLGSAAIAKFFEDKPYGLAYVAIDNLSSFHAYKKAGFFTTKSSSVQGPDGKRLYTMLKEPSSIKIGLESVPPIYSKW